MLILLLAITSAFLWGRETAGTSNIGVSSTQRTDLMLRVADDGQVICVDTNRELARDIRILWSSVLAARAMPEITRPAADLDGQVFACEFDHPLVGSVIGEPNLEDPDGDGIDEFNCFDQTFTFASFDTGNGALDSTLIEWSPELNGFRLGLCSIDTDRNDVDVVGQKFSTLAGTEIELVDLTVDGSADLVVVDGETLLLPTSAPWWASGLATALTTTLLGGTFGWVIARYGQGRTPDPNSSGEHHV